MGDWKIISKLTDPIIASLVEGRLKAEGIPVILRTKEAAGSIYGLTTGPLAEIKILVPADRTAEALELLQQLENEPFENELSETEEDDYIHESDGEQEN